MGNRYYRSGATIDAKEIVWNKLNPIGLYEEILSFLLPLSSEYPGIQDWYFNKVIPGEQANTRKTIRIYRDNRLVGLGIGKKEAFEEKICTVRVLPEYAGQGIGSEIFERLMEWIGSDQPVITVNDSKVALFEPIFKKFGFRLTSIQRGVYAEGALEFFYNEPRALAQWLGPFTSDSDAAKLTEEEFCFLEK